MLRILIAYASKTGTARNCVCLLEKELKGLNVTVVDLDREHPDAGNYDILIVGGSVRYGKLRASAAEFLREQESVICRKPHGLFLCCGFGHEFEDYSERIFSAALRDSAFSLMNFGGSLKLPDAGIREKILLYFIRNSIRESEIEDGEYTPTLPGILPENISMMASSLRRELIRLK